MSQDFAKKRRANSRSGTAKRRKSNSKKNSNQNAGGWVWFSAGLLLGSFATFLLFLSGVIPAPDQTPAAQVAAAEKPAAEKKPEVPQPRFDFYELLKESEVVVEKSPDAYDGGGEREQKNMEYLLQVGSFRSPNEADQLHAKLAITGFDAQVEKVKVRNGSIWHRVLVGPYSSRSKLANTRGKLISQGIETLVIEREAQP
ncbi:MAG: SPOR domain-containing protein [Cellvibrionaceae bacterium]|nr:SPOR domain-containing protein [Cellvibrionaceae bacterium]